MARKQSYLIAQIFCFCLFLYGLWVALTQRARFDIGGSDTGTSRHIHVNAEGLDAIAIGGFIMGLGLAGIVQHMSSAARRPLAFVAIAMMGVPILYSVFLIVRAVWRLFAS